MSMSKDACRYMTKDVYMHIGDCRYMVPYGYMDAIQCMDAYRYMEPRRVHWWGDYGKTRRVHKGKHQTHGEQRHHKSSPTIDVKKKHSALQHESHLQHTLSRGQTRIRHIYVHILICNCLSNYNGSTTTTSEQQRNYYYHIMLGHDVSLSDPSGCPPSGSLPQARFFGLCGQITRINSYVMR